MTIEEYTEILENDGQGINHIRDISQYRDSIYHKSYMCNTINSSDAFRNSMKTHNLNCRYTRDHEYGNVYEGSIKLNNEYDWIFDIEYITNRLADNMYYYRYRMIFSKNRFLHVKKEV